jgi:hypothetical protein
LAAALRVRHPKPEQRAEEVIRRSQVAMMGTDEAIARAIASIETSKNRLIRHQNEIDREVALSQHEIDNQLN